MKIPLYQIHVEWNGKWADLEVLPGRDISYPAILLRVPALMPDPIYLNLHTAKDLASAIVELIEESQK